MKRKKWDVFVCHASEDKEAIAKPLANILSAFGVKVWYDEFTITVGDSLSRSIDKGLANSNFGIIILSPSFFLKGFAEYELRGLTAKEIGGRKVILPIWHKITRKDVLRYSPPLADKWALRTEQYSLQEIAIKLLKIIRPDILKMLHRKLAYTRLIKLAETKKVAFKKLVPSKIRHKKLSNDLVGRIRLIRAALLDVLPYSMEFWIDGFRRDIDPVREIKWWEHIAACYAEIVKMKRLTHKQRKSVFAIIFGLLNNLSTTELKKQKDSIPKVTLKMITKTIVRKVPAYDLNMVFPKGTIKIPQKVVDLFSEIDNKKNK